MPWAQHHTLCSGCAERCTLCSCNTSSSTTLTMAAAPPRIDTLLPCVRQDDSGIRLRRSVLVGQRHGGAEPHTGRLQHRRRVRSPPGRPLPGEPPGPPTLLHLQHAQSPSGIDSGRCRVPGWTVCSPVRCTHRTHQASSSKVAGFILLSLFTTPELAVSWMFGPSVRSANSLSACSVSAHTIDGLLCCLCCSWAGPSRGPSTWMRIMSRASTSCRPSVFRCACPGLLAPLSECLHFTMAAARDYDMRPPYHQVATSPSHFARHTLPICTADTTIG